MMQVPLVEGLLERVWQQLVELLGLG